MSQGASTTPLPPSNSRLHAIREATKTCLRIPTEDWLAVDYVVSILVSNVWSPDADPLWGWLIGPPGSYKTELVRPHQDHPKTHWLSSMTPHALVSGYDANNDGTDNSLLPKLNNKVLTIKDFTSVLSLNPQDIKTIFGDLRDIYDGYYAKAFGNVGCRSYKVKMGLLACVTPAIDGEACHHVILGERFLSMRICRHGFRNHGGRIEFLRHVANAMSDKSSWRANLQRVWKGNLDSIFENLPSVVTVPSDLQDKIIFCADILARARNLPLIRKTAESLPEYATITVAEVASRLVNQLTNLALARAAADGRAAVEEEDLMLVRRVTVDSLPPVAYRIMRGMFATGREYAHITAMAQRIGIPAHHLSPILANWRDHSQELATCQDAKATVAKVNPRNAEWRLSDDTLDEINQAGLPFH